MSVRRLPFDSPARRLAAPGIDSALAHVAARRSMETAATLFARSRTPGRLVVNAARVLSVDPGLTCLVTLVSGPLQHLRPVAVAHPRRSAARELRVALARMAEAPVELCVDAFSRAVQRSGRSVRVPIGDPHVLRLWLPSALWAYAEQQRVTDVLAVPLLERGRVLGTLLLWREGDQPRYTAADEAYVTAIGRRLALGLRAS